MGTPGGLAAGTAPTSSGDRRYVCRVCSGAGVRLGRRFRSGRQSDSISVCTVIWSSYSGFHIQTSMIIRPPLGPRFIFEGRGVLSSR
jgi:hypothetical protein